MRTSSEYICRGYSALSFDSTLALIFGMTETFIICQIQYWVNRKTEKPEEFRDSFHDDRIWVYNSYSEWLEQFPFMGRTKFITAIKNLEKQGILITGNYNKKPYDKTKWYSIDYEKLDKIVEDWYAENRHTYAEKRHSYVKNRQGSMSDSDKPIPENTIPSNTPYNSPDNNSYNVYKGRLPEEKSSDSRSRDYEPFDYGIFRNQITKACNTIMGSDKIYIDIDNIGYIIEFYFREYKKVLGREHPRLKQDNMEKVVAGIISGTSVINEYDSDTYEKIIRKHFETNYPKGICDYNIIQFMTSEKMRNNRYYETVDYDEDEEELPFE